MSVKATKIIYWIATIWLVLGMVSTGVVQFTQNPVEIDMFNHLGYPVYLMVILGICKILGSIVILLPKWYVLKEWAYAGFFFMMSGAVISHFVLDNPLVQILPAILLLLLTLVSWYVRPMNRKVAELN